MKEKGEGSVYIGFGFVKEMKNGKEGGLCVKWEVRWLSLPTLVMGEGFECFGIFILFGEDILFFCGEDILVKIFWRIWWKEKKGKKKEKGKENEKRKIFSWKKKWK